MAAADRPAEVTASRLAVLLGISQRAVQDLAARDVIKRGVTRGGYLLVPSINSYCSHLRQLAQGQGGEAAVAEAAKQRAKLSKAQAALAEAKASKLSGETVEVSEVEAFWKGKLRVFRSRVLAIGDRLRHLQPRDHVLLMSELRAALDELASAK